MIINLKNFLGLKVDDVDFGLGDVQNNNLLVVHHSKEVDDLVILPFEEDFSGCITMDDTLLRAGTIHPHKDKSSFEGRGSAKDLREVFGKLDSGFVLEQHI